MGADLHVYLFIMSVYTCCSLTATVVEQAFTLEASDVIIALLVHAVAAIAYSSCTIQ